LENLSTKAARREGDRATRADGHTAQVVALATHDTEGLLATIDVYGRPWRYMGLIREWLMQVDPHLADPNLGTALFRS
jgi:hypothetical protein